MLSLIAHNERTEKLYELQQIHRLLFFGRQKYRGHDLGVLNGSYGHEGCPGAADGSIPIGPLAKELDCDICALK